MRLVRGELARRAADAPTGTPRAAPRPWGLQPAAQARTCMRGLLCTDAGRSSSEPPSCPHDTWQDGAVLATALNLRALFVGREQAASLLLADAQLCGLPGWDVAAASGGGSSGGGICGSDPGPCAVEGAVVALAGPPGQPLALRLVARIERLAIAPDGARAGCRRGAWRGSQQGASLSTGEARRARCRRRRLLRSSCMRPHDRAGGATIHLYLPLHA